MVNNLLTATEALKKIQAEEISTQDLVTQTLHTITHQEAEIQAWEYLDTAVALEQAKFWDGCQSAGQPRRKLQGIPIAIKDIFATADMPTGWGTPIHQGAMLNCDAAVVEQLRLAGAILFGKTVTTEYAAARPGKTRNPHNINHTPGGSSSGSAASVAAGMVPLALGTQTMGSILRPAAYCGVLGFKPSFGSISRYGVMPVCRELDHVGVFARTVADIQLLCAVLATPDGRDPDCCGNTLLQNWAPSNVGVQHYQPSAKFMHDQLHSVRLAAWKTPFWDRIESETQQRFLDCITLMNQAGGMLTSNPQRSQITLIELPPEFANCYEDAQTLMTVGLAVNHGDDYDTYLDQLSPQLQRWIESGRKTTAIDYGKIRQRTVEYSRTLTRFFAEYDAILTPVTTGAAPANLEDTGSPVLCTLSSLCGLPAISIPCGRAANGLPLAVQLMGQKFCDRFLLEIADGLHNLLQSAFP